MYYFKVTAEKCYGALSSVELVILPDAILPQLTTFRKSPFPLWDDSEEYPSEQPFRSSQNSSSAQICRSSRAGLPYCRNIMAYTGKENSRVENKVSSIQYVTHCCPFKPRNYEYVKETMQLFWLLQFLVLATRSQSGKVLFFYCTWSAEEIGAPSCTCYKSVYRYSM